MTENIKPHPRLLIKDFEKLKILTQTEPFLIKCRANLLNSADAELKRPVQAYGMPDGLRIPRDAPHSMPILAFAFLLSGDERYKERLWREVEAVALYPDWNPAHNLDTGDILRGMAYAFDWLYGFWSEAERRVIKNGIIKNGLTAVLPNLKEGTGFAVRKNNWNQVVNAGAGIAALALADEDGCKELVEEIISLGLKSLPAALQTFAPDGACPEGVGYWGYAQQTFFQYVGSLFSALGKDFGLSAMPGLSNSAYFSMYMTGPAGFCFNYADSAEQAGPPAVLFLMADIYNLPDVAKWAYSARYEAGGWDDIVMFSSTGGAVFNPPPDKIFRGIQETASFRSDWDENALFIAFKGGNNQTDHGDLDIGSYVIDALGERFVCELGSEPYSLPEIFNYHIGAGRWKYYRKRAEGNNTPCINPTGGEDQNPYASAKITEFVSKPGFASAVIDMTEAYAGKAASLERRVTLAENRSKIIIEDIIVPVRESEIFSFAHTQADVEITGKTAVLTRNGKKMRVDLETTAGEADFYVTPAQPLPSSPNPGGTADNYGYRKLAVRLKTGEKVKITLTFTPLG